MADTNEEIKNVLESAGINLGGKVSESPIRYLVCSACGNIHEYQSPNMPPVSCEKCNKKVRFIFKTSLELAEKESENIQKSLTEPVKTLEPVKTSEPVKASEPVQESVEVQTPAPTSRPKVTKKVETTKPAETSPVADSKDLREAAIKSLKKTFKLNEISTVEVGTAEAFSIGFTMWQETDDGRRIPAYCFMEPFDTPQTFREALSEARKQDSSIQVDAVQLTNLPPNIADCAYGGRAIATSMSKTGPIRVKIGDKVIVGARMAKSGNIIWSVLGITK